jgi:F-type H+-transporting ATPase subunit delta
MMRLPQQYAKILFELLSQIPKEKEGEAMRAFLELLHREQALSKSPYIIREFERYAEEQNGVVNLHLTTARTLSEAEQKHIAKVFGEKTNITNEVQEKLMGGIKITTGDTIIDATVQTKLARLAHSLTT